MLGAMGVLRVVVMGVTSSGKSTVGARIAARLDAEFVDGDELHPIGNVEKMANGEPLTDADRGPWLQRVRDALARSERIIVACSALKREYRDVLREAGDVQFVFLDVDPTTARRRARRRRRHFMRADMVASQFVALERPTDDETDVITVDVARPHEVVQDEIVHRLDIAEAG